MKIKIGKVYEVAQGCGRDFMVVGKKVKVMKEN